jgi:rhomboid family GlyGly-CTERM serine protease
MSITITSTKNEYICFQTPGTNPTQQNMRIKLLQYDLILLTVLLVLCNLHLFGGTSPAAVSFLPDSVADGEWWRIITHAFVHISWYHLLIDGAAFFLLYTCLQDTAVWKKLVYVAACAAGSLGAAFFSDTLYSHGLCGLSGTAHGLMAVVACEFITSHRRSDVLIGLVCFALVIGKTVIELTTGRAFFSSMHLGSIGIPIVECHAGGIIGGCIMFLIFHLSTRANIKTYIFPLNKRG